MKKSLIIVAHGSRRVESNDEVKALAQKLSQITLPGFTDITFGFLELAEPSIPDAILQRIAAGAESVLILPYFLSAGRHVTIDIPNEVSKVQQQYPDFPLTISPYLGAAEGLLDLMSKIAIATDKSEEKYKTKQ